MKRMKKLIAALLVLTVVLSLGAPALAASAKFSEKDTNSQNGKLVFAKFKCNLPGYRTHSASGKSDVVVRKGSLAQVVGVYGKKWVKLRLVLSFNMDRPSVERWFKTDELKRVVDPDFVWEPYHEPRYHNKVTFCSGGSGASWQEDVTTDPKLAGKRIKTTGKVNLRKTASLEGKSCGTVKKGQKVTLNGKVGIDTRDAVFFGVTVNKKDYFVSSRYLDIKGYTYKYSEGYEGWF